jgi:hypothetical protein
MLKHIETRAALLMLSGALILASGAELHAETAILRNGRSIEVSGFRMSGDRVVLRMAGGGELSLPAPEVLEIRRQPAEESPVPPSPTLPATPTPGPAEEPGTGTITTEPASPATPEPGAPLLPIGGVFDPAALHAMAAQVARRHGVDEALVLAVIQVESRYDPFAVSPRGAMGLMQLMPKTAERFAVSNAFDPVQNVDGGVRYLKELLARYSGQVRLALAAYNAGEEAVERHSGIPPYRETVDYVRRVMAARR